MKIKFFLPLIPLLFSVKIKAQNWSKAVISESKDQMEVVSSGSKIFFFGGYKKDGLHKILTDQIEMFDVNNNSLTVLTLPEKKARSQGSATAYGSKILYGGGQNSDHIFSDRIDIYDTITGLWSLKKLTAGRWTMGSTSGAGLSFFAGGYNFDRTYQEIDIYNHAADSMSLDYYGVFSQSAPVRDNFTAAFAGTKVLFAGGSVAATLFDMVNIYDTKESRWLEDNFLSEPKTRLKSLTYKNRIYFLGGFQGELPADTIDVYDTQTGSWAAIKIPHFFKTVDNKPRPYLQAVSAGSKIFLVPLMEGAGVSPHNPAFARTDSVLVYDIERNKWDLLSLPQPRFGVTAAATLNKVYFAGGRSLASGEFVNNVDILTLQPKLKLEAENSTEKYNFGNILIAEEKSVLLDLENEGDYFLLLKNNSSGIKITGDISDFFVDLATVKDTIEPADNFNIPVKFKPVSAGNKEITLSVYTNDPTNPVKNFIFEGTADISTGTFTTEHTKELVKVFPNPADEKIFIQPVHNQTMLSATLKDLHGNLLAEHTIAGKEISINTSDYPAGIYILEIIAENERQIKKIVINF